MLSCHLWDLTGPAESSVAPSGTVGGGGVLGPLWGLPALGGHKESRITSEPDWPDAAGRGPRESLEVVRNWFQPSEPRTSCPTELSPTCAAVLRNQNISVRPKGQSGSVDRARLPIGCCTVVVAISLLLDTPGFCHTSSTSAVSSEPSGARSRMID